MTARRIRIAASTALSMRLHWEGRATTADLIALLRCLDITYPSDAWSAFATGMPIEEIMTQPDLRRLAGVTSGPAIGPMLDRLRDLHLADPYSIRGASYPMRAFDAVVPYERGPASAVSRVIAQLNPRTAAFHGVSGAETCFASDPGLLRGLSLPSAFVMLRWLAVQYLPYRAARDALRGQAGLHVARGRVIFDVGPDAFCSGFVGRWLGRKHEAEPVWLLADAEEVRRVTGLVRRELEAKGLKVRVDRPKAAFARSPVVLIIDGTLAGHGPVEFAKDEIGTPPADLMLSPLETPRPPPSPPPREIVPAITLPPGVYH